MRGNWFNVAVLAVVALAVCAIVAIKIIKPGDAVIMPQKGECTVVYIGGTLCRPCELLKPVIKELEKSLEGRAKVVSMLLNDSNKKAYKIELIPTIAIFGDNAEEVERRIISEEEVPGVPAWIDGVLKGLGK